MGVGEMVKMERGGEGVKVELNMGWGGIMGLGRNVVSGCGGEGMMGEGFKE